MRLVLDEIEPTKKRSIEKGRRKLADTSAKVLCVHSVLDDVGLEEPVCCGAGPDGVVDRERLTWFDHDAPDEVSNVMNVFDSHFTGCVFGGEGRNQLCHAERFNL